ncbi:hypothetical protein HJC23_005744 [Cyclotella cryptica]|uniref:J domain-containing protein n=1 Tax=Cyclotella cryptica TaxID=29204 RepID=A0ABD3QCW0_9STRA
MEHCPIRKHPHKRPQQPQRHNHSSILTLLLLTTLTLTTTATSKSSFYQTLGIPPTATPTQIKKAYRSLALQHHPDKVPPEQRPQAEHRFKEINKAYEWLSDEKKREMYDRYGEGGMMEGGMYHEGGFAGAGEAQSRGRARQSHGGSGGTRTFHFFGPGSNAGGFSDMFGSSGGNGPSSDFSHVDLNELIRQMMGGVPMGKSCPGEEGYYDRRRQGFGGDASSSSSSFYPNFGQASQKQQRQRPTRHAKQSTKTKDYTRPIDCTLQELCLGCTKKLKVSFPHVGEKIYTVHIRPGWKGGTKIKFPAQPKDDGTSLGRGVQDGRDEGYYPPITFVVREKEHPYLKRKGDDLHWKCTLTTRQSERGAKLRLPLPDGSVLEVQSGAGTRSGETMTVSGRGMLGKSGRKGDVVIEFLVAD